MYGFYTILDIRYVVYIQVSLCGASINVVVYRQDGGDWAMGFTCTLQ